MTEEKQNKVVKTENEVSIVDELFKNLKNEKEDTLKIAEDLIERAVPFDIDKDFENTTQIEEVKPKEEKKKQRKKVDLDKITINTERDVISKEQDIKNALFGNKSAFQVACAQSGYAAKVIPLVHKDTINLLYSNLGRYEYKKAVYKVIFDKTVAFSSGKMTFEEWLKNTSVEDLETFYYGIYCATFPNQGSFAMVCPKCGDERTYTVSHSNLFKTSDREAMRELISKVSRESTTKEKMREFSLLKKFDTFELEDTKIIVELRTPSLWDSLEILRLVPEHVIDRDQMSVTNMLYVQRLIIPMKGNVNSYCEVIDREEILRIIDNLPIEDASELQDAVSERVDSNRITYSIKNVKCPNCGEEINEVPISIEDILFNLIFDHAQ